MARISKQTELRLQFQYSKRANSLLTVIYKGGVIHSGNYDGTTIYRAMVDWVVLGYSTTEATAKKQIRNYLKGDL
jgi:hypothetical protein